MHWRYMQVIAGRSCVLDSGMAQVKGDRIALIVDDSTLQEVRYEHLLAVVAVAIQKGNAMTVLRWHQDATVRASVVEQHVGRK